MTKTVFIFYRFLLKDKNHLAQKDCYGINSSVKSRQMTGSYNPGLSSLYRSEMQNNYLFDRTRGIPSFPSGSS